MLVTSVEDKITHAIIGGSQTIDFGISNNAEFFQILSSSLYTNQILAVVREVLCNAWDAHIEAGVTDKPIQITISDSELIIRDFGKGIPHDDIAPIYGVYGQSTKKSNGQVTGGFGLGCKAPFAYQDHFEVTSWNQGNKAIYAMCRSSADTEGKPGITHIVSLPTTESGIQVKIQLKLNDRRKFMDYITQVVLDGDILAVVNNDVKPLPMNGYCNNTLGFAITPQQTLYTTTAITIRYGNVVYPLNKQKEYEVEYVEALKEIKRINSYYRLVLLAEPHSICVSPSREALSMQTKTVDTVKKLLLNFVSTVTAPTLTKSIDNCLVEAVKKAISVKNTTYADFINGRLGTPIGNKDVIHNIHDLIWFKYKNIKPSPSRSIRLKYGPQFFKHKVLARQYIKASLFEKCSDEVTVRRFFIKNYLAKFIKDCANSGVCDPKIKFLDNSRYTTVVYDSTSDIYFGRYSTTIADTAYVVLTHAPSLVKTKLNEWPDAIKGFFTIITVSKKEPNLDKLRSSLAKRKNIEVLDLTVKQDWEEKKERSKPESTRPSGLVKASLLFSNWMPHNKTESLIKEDYVTKPLFVLQASVKDKVLHRILPHYLHTFVKKYGDVGGICMTATSFQARQADGAMSIVDFAASKMREHLLNSKKAARYYNIRSHSYNANRIAQCIIDNTELAKIFGVYTDMDQTDMMYMHLLNNLPDSHPHVREVIIKFKQKAINPFFERLHKVCDSDLFMKYIDATAFSIMLGSANPSFAKEQKEAIELLKSKLI